MLSKAFLASFLVFGTATSFVSAAYSISDPNSDTVWKANDQVAIKWTGTDEPNVDVRLVYGNSNNLQEYAVICSNVDSSAGQCTYTVDSGIPSNINYAVTVGKSSSLYGYSSYFTIEAKGPLPTNNGCPKMGGNNCTSSLPCCSASGYCGATADYCGTGCQAKYSFNGKCSNDANTATTSTGKSTSTSPTTTTSSKTTPTSGTCGGVACSAEFPCCSQYNYCGSSKDHCGAGCQPGKSFNGQCVGSTKSTTTTTKAPSPTNPTKQRKCGNTLCKSHSPCCSKYNYCGSSKAHCGAGCQPGKSFNGHCLSNPVSHIVRGKDVGTRGRFNPHRVKPDGSDVPDGSEITSKVSSTLSSATP